MKKILYLLLLCSVQFSVAQSGTDIYIGKLNENKYTIKKIVKITSQKGYDNQPYFHPDKPLLYYTSEDASGNTDIKVYNYKKKTTNLFLNSPTVKEYSPTITPDATSVSCIMQLENNAQNLGKYTLNNQKADTILTHLTVGYHCWVTEEVLALFVLGDPLTLRLYNTSLKKDWVVDTNIGRSLHPIPNKPDHFSYVSKSQDLYKIYSFNINTNAKTLLTQTINNSEDIAWTFFGKIVSSDGKRLYINELDGSEQWLPFKADLPNGIGTISRIAIHPEGEYIAFVVNEN